MNELEEIRKKAGAPKGAHACSCPECESMCRKCPCLGTPQDILKLINNGHAEKLALTGWAAGLPMGVPIIPMVQAQQLPDGSCIFLDQPTNRCTLHASGLKPAEGKISSHEPSYFSIALMVAKTWTQPKNMRTINLVMKAYRAIAADIKDQFFKTDDV